MLELDSYLGMPIICYFLVTKWFSERYSAPPDKYHTLDDVTDNNNLVFFSFSIPFFITMYTHTRYGVVQSVV